ncbi:MAG: trypsin-like peptidase domain-containing protein [Thermoguttaceae bacterium]
MRKLIFLCLLSGITGITAAVFWFGGPALEPKSVAQEPALSSQPTGNASPSGPAGNASAPQGAANQLTAADLQHLTPDEQVNVLVYQNVNRSVVNINTTGERSFFGVADKGEGSGSVIDRQGHILTNFHVIKGARQIRVTLFDGSDYMAQIAGVDPATDVAVQIVGVDPATDVAVLKIKAPAELLYPVTFGSSTNLLVGQRVFAIGNPFGLERTLSTGIISSLNRSLLRRPERTLKSVIQIDAAMNPGNSGGPLLDSHGLMIGMNTAIATSTGESAGVGFAIPINTIRRVVPQLISTGRVLRPESGIGKVYQTDQGLLVLTLVPGGPAQKAGLQGPQVKQQRQGPFTITLPPNLATADLIIAVDGKPVRTGDNFIEAVESKRAGDQVVLTVIREGKQIQVPLRLEAAE